MRNLRTWAVALIATISVTACTHFQKTPPTGQPVAAKPAENRIRILEYNVENLFDTVHDEGKNDWEFLPRDAAGKAEFCATEPAHFQARCLESDWTDDKLEIKLGQIAKVVAKSGPQPDILALVEVENERVARKLADKLGYKGVAIAEGPDPRGIDVALIFNEKPGLRFLGFKAERVDLKKQTDRSFRDILVGEFEYGTKEKRKLAVIVNHWPSQSNPVHLRRLFADKVRDLTVAYMKKGFDVLATGDFNVDQVNDHPCPFLAFFQGNEPILFDVDRVVREKARELKIDVSRMPPGTYFYAQEGSENRFAAMTWNMLDRFFVSKSLLNKVDLRSFRIVNDEEFTKTYTYRYGPLAGSRVTGVPMRYSHRAEFEEVAGYSDHFAIVMEIEFH